MNQKQLSEFIGTSERTLRRMSPRKRQQWKQLAEKGRTITWFDIVTLLTFEVEVFNTARPSGENISLTFDGHGVAIYHMNKIFETIKSAYISEIEKLTETLQYVQDLNNAK